jgi:hypothetical protein
MPELAALGRVVIFHTKVEWLGIVAGRLGYAFAFSPGTRS